MSRVRLALAMMTPCSSPDVDIEGMRPRSRGIVGIDSSVTAFVGRTRRGPVDQPVSVASFGEFERVFGRLWSKSQLGYSIREYFDQGGFRAVVVRVHRSDPADLATIRLGTVPRQITLEALSPGSWGQRLTATIAASPGRAGLLDLTVADGASGVRESFQHVSLRPRSRRRLDTVLDRSTLVRVRGALPEEMPRGLPLTSEALGGNDGGRLGSGDYTAGPGMRQKGRGVYSLSRVDPIGLIVVPPYSRRGLPRRVVADTIAYAEERGSVMLLDPLRAWDTAEKAAAGVAARMYPTSPNAALYFPSIVRTDPAYGGRIAEFPPSGAIAGVIARTDRSRGVWKSAAGVEATLNGIAGLSVALSSQDINSLNQLGVNCLRTLPPSRHVVWGARTRSGTEVSASQWTYLAVRRTALFLEHSIERGTRWTAFEPNNETSWSVVRSTVGEFLHTLYRQGAFPGATPEESYFVKCGATTMTQDDLDQGVVNIVVGFAPLKPAEFVVIRISHKVA